MKYVIARFDKSIWIYCKLGEPYESEPTYNYIPLSEYKKSNLDTAILFDSVDEATKYCKELNIKYDYIMGIKNE